MVSSHTLVTMNACTKVSGQTPSLDMARAFSFGKTAVNLLESGWMIKLVAGGGLYTRMVATIMESGEKVRHRGPVHTIVLSAESLTRDNGTKTVCTVSELKFGQIPQSIKVTIDSVKKTALVTISG